MKISVKQGCVLSPTLFAIYFAASLQHDFDGSEDGVYLKTRFEASLFNLKRLTSKTRTTEELIIEFLFADDPTIEAHSKIELQ